MGAGRRAGCTGRHEGLCAKRGGGQGPATGRAGTVLGAPLPPAALQLGGAAGQGPARPGTAAVRGPRPDLLCIRWALRSRPSAVIAEMETRFAFFAPSGLRQETLGSWRCRRRCSRELALPSAVPERRALPPATASRVPGPGRVLRPRGRGRVLRPEVEAASPPLTRRLLWFAVRVWVLTLPGSAPASESHGGDPVRLPGGGRRRAATRPGRGCLRNAGD